MLKLPSKLERRKRGKRRRNGKNFTEKKGLRIPPQSPESTIPLAGGHDFKNTSAKSLDSLVTKNDTMQISISSHPSKKTSVSLGNLCVGD